MPNKNYVRGRDLEYRIIKLLENAGYNAIRTAGSHGVFDVIAWDGLCVRFIQAKRTETSSTKYDIDIERIQDTDIPKQSTAELWVWYAPKDEKGYWLKKDIIKKG